MSSMTTKHAYYSILAYWLGTVAALANPASTLVVDSVIASEDNQPIMQSQLEIIYQQYRTQSSNSEFDLKREILQQLIVNKVMLAQAQQEGVKVTEEEVESEVARRIQRMLAQASIRELEQHFGKSLAQIRSELREQLREQLVIDKMRNKIIGAITATPIEVKAFFDAYPPHKLPYYPVQVVVRQIVKYTVNKETAATYDLSGPFRQPIKEAGAAYGLLGQLRQSILNGTITFQQAVSEHSEDPYTAKEGGLLTDREGHTRIALDKLPYDVYLAIEPLSAGDISLPTAFETEEGEKGMRILWLQETIPSHRACLERDYPALQQMTLHAKQEAALQQWLHRAQETVHIVIAPRYRHYLTMVAQD